MLKIYMALLIYIKCIKYLQVSCAMKVRTCIQRFTKNMLKKGGSYPFDGCGDISLEVGWHMIIVYCLLTCLESSYFIPS